MPRPIHALKLRKTVILTITIGLIILFFLGAGGTANALAQGEGTPTPPATASGPDSEYFSSQTITLEDGTSLEEVIINGPPEPPAGYELERQAVKVPETNRDAGTKTLTVPAFDWFFGCSATSGAMIAAYYDRNGFSNMYTGATNGGVMPLDSSLWPDWTDGSGYTYGQCPLTASRLGLDGRTTRGSIDDYWVEYGSSTQDPYITNGWTQHTWGDAIGDYMRTSQSGYDNTDGSTSFYNWSSSTSPLTCSDMVSNGITRDGTYGRKLFYEAKGYTVTDCYNRKTDNNGGGFTFAMYKAEIDAGHPLIINLAGHSVVGVGYDDSTSTIYIHDTWDYLIHNMTWGGSYSGMTLLSVSVVNIATPLDPPAAFSKTSPTSGATGLSTSPTLSWGTSSGAASYEYCYDMTNDNACSNWTSTGATNSASLSGLSAGSVYYWQVKAVNTSGTTYANGSATAFWPFTTLSPTIKDKIRYIPLVWR